MFKNIHIPPSYASIKRGKVFLILKESYKDPLLQQGIEDIDKFLHSHRETSRYLRGRALHPVVPLSDRERMVIRQYFHGGFFGGITRDLYLFGARSVTELSLTERIFSSGIPTLQPIGAIHLPTLLFFYKAYFLSLEIPEAKDLIQYFQEVGPLPSREKLLHKRKTIRSAGLLLRQFHQAGFLHGDLQLKNILVKGDQTLLIDFDRSCQKKLLSSTQRMRNLLRLNRSVEKWKRYGVGITRTDRLRFFRAYADDDVEFRKAMHRVFRTYSLRLFLYRFGWELQGVLGK